MKFGKFDIEIISDGTFRLDGGAMFGVVPKIIWNSLTPADDDNRILLALDALLVKFEDRIIVLEGGIGDKFNKAQEEIYCIERSGGMLEKLKKKGISTEDVTDVIPSHLHFDHAGFLTYKDESGEFVPTFPKARHHVQKKHLDWAINASRKDRASFRKEDFEPIIKRKLIDVYDGDYSLFGYIDLFVSNGHTPFQQHACLKNAQEMIVFSGDLIPTSNHIKLPYNMGYDNRPVENIEEKKLLLERIVKTHSLLYFYHDPTKKLVSVKEGKKDFEIDEVLKV